MRPALLTTLLTFLAIGSAAAQPRCVKGKPCGNSCIAQNKTCRIGTATPPKSPPAKDSTRPGVAVPLAKADVALTEPAITLRRHVQRLVHITNGPQQENWTYVRLTAASNESFQFVSGTKEITLPTSRVDYTYVETDGDKKTLVVVLRK